MSGQYEVLNPWAEVDPLQIKGLSPRMPDLKGKTVGLFYSYKTASRPIVEEAGKRLQERFPTIKLSPFHGIYSLGRGFAESQETERFEKWVKGVDAIISAVGD